MQQHIGNVSGDNLPFCLEGIVGMEDPVLEQMHPDVKAVLGQYRLAEEMRDVLNANASFFGGSADPDPWDEGDDDEFSEAA